MGRRGRVTPGELAKSIERARSLVAGHSDPAVPPGERLHEIGKKLNVTQIGAGAADAAGFLSQQADGTFAIFYANDQPERRRFTVAHELAHIVLERYHKHLRIEGAQLAYRGNTAHSWSIERAVDRIAAELLMPESLVVGLIKNFCAEGRQSSPTGLIDKRKVVGAVKKALGVSEQALVLRLLELSDLLAVRLEFISEPGIGGRSTNRIGIFHSPHGALRDVVYPEPSLAVLEQEDTWELPVILTTKWGRRKIRCHGWRRSSRTQPKRVETWVVGWSWNFSPLPSWDDSDV